MVGKSKDSSAIKKMKELESTDTTGQEILQNSAYGPDSAYFPIHDTQALNFVGLQGKVLSSPHTNLTTLQLILKKSKFRCNLLYILIHPFQQLKFVHLQMKKLTPIN
jgi:hypothetical protein